MAQVLATWQAPEFEFKKKTADWYWAVWIIVVSLSVIAVVFHDTLLAVLIIIGALTLSMLSNKPPALIEYEINTNGIRIGTVLYPYQSLDSFDIEEFEGQQPKLLIKSKKLFMQLLIVPIRGFHSDDIRAILNDYMIEDELHTPLVQRIIDFLGF